MIKNYFKIAWRNMIRNRVNSFINIAGLAIGMICVILILFYVEDELKYDRFLQHASRIYQVNLEGTDNGVVGVSGNTGPAVGPTMVKEFPEIEACVRIHRPGDKMVSYEQNKQAANYFTEKHLLAVDSNFLQVFTYETIAGDPATCLEKPDAVVLTKETAQKYFGNSNPIGKTLLIGNEKKPYAVSAVVANIPSQSSIQFDMLVPISSYPDVKRRSWNWWWLQVNTYVKLRDNAGTDKESITKIEAKFPAMVKQHAFTRNNPTFEEFIKKGNKLTYHLQPLTSVHLYASGMGTTARLTTLGDIKYVRIFSFIALIIIILACVNFMNLSTAQSAKRSKEVGIRKVLGSEKKQLVKQFLVEAVLHSLVAMVIALVCVLLLLKPFNAIAGKSLDFNLLFTGNMWILVLGLALCTGLFAGSYPAFYLTSFNPVKVLKGMKLFRSSFGSLFIRNGLVVFQFTISTALIIATIVIYQQLQFTRSKDLGFDKENVVIISNSERLGQQEESFRQELTKLPAVANAAITTGIPIIENFGDTYVPVPGAAGEQLIKEIPLSSFMIDYDFIPTLDIRMLKGRNFSRDFSDSGSVILNETAARQIGWQDPVGMTLEYPGNNQSFKVIGVAKDFNIGSLQTAVAPFALFHASSRTYGLGHSYIMARMKPGNMSTYLSQLESKWKGFAPNTPFDYSFLDSELDALYRSEKRMGTIFIIFTVLSIFVACLGLFGLAAYTA
ncbi:MAG TPA: ABC transporter permease, partial [Chitinophagaceae bacterium]|nr:ABC transporter permease [Chitinophagaceae bacterium]